jgi:predicted Zn-dependent peptidase
MSNTVLDRTIAPPIVELNNFEITKANSFLLQNKIKIHTIKYGVQEVIKLELVFNAGNYFEDKPGQAFLTSKMLTEGTSTLSSKEIAEKFSYYGANYEIIAGNDKLIIAVTVLNKFLHYILPIVKDIVKNTVMQESNFEDVKRIASKQLEVNYEKTNFIASGTLKQHIFGMSSAYGYFLSPEILNNVTIEDCQFHYHSRIKDSSFEVIVSGYVTNSIVEQIDAILGREACKLPASVAVRREFLSLLENIPIISRCWY